MGRIKEFFGLETRANYSDTITDLLVRSLQGKDLLNAVSAAEGTARNIVSRAFMSATVSGDDGLLTPRILSTIGQDLIRSGQSILFLSAGRLNPVSGWEILPDGRYEMTYTPYRTAPGSAKTIRTPRTRVFHADSGLVSLADLAADTTFLRRIEKSFSQQSSAAVAHIIPSPLPGPKMNAVRTQLQNMKGASTFLESLGQINKAMSDGNSPAEDWSQRDFGPRLRAENSEVYESIIKMLLGAMGVPSELAGFPSPGTSRREAYRQLTHSLITPLSKTITEAMADLGRTVTFDWSGLASADSQGRARALKSLVDSGMSLEEAMIHTGFLDADES